MIFEYGLYYIIPNKFGKQMFGGTSGNTGLPAISVERKQRSLFQQVEQELFAFRIADQFSPRAVALLPYTQVDRGSQYILILDTEIGECFSVFVFRLDRLMRTLFDGGH